MHVSGQVDCSDSTFENSRGPALNFERAVIGGHLLIRGSSILQGELRLFGTDVGGQLNCAGSRFHNPVTKTGDAAEAGDAINASGVRVAGHTHLSDGFYAEGSVILSGAKIGGQLICSKGQFENGDEFAIYGGGSQIDGDVYLNNHFEAIGIVDLSGSTVMGQFVCIGSSFKNESGYALVLEQTHAGELHWMNVAVPAGMVSLIDAQMDVLVDDLNSWPTGDRLLLNGFVYDRIATFTDAKQRLKWLAFGAILKGKFYPQPYEQLAKVLKAMGHERERRTVLVEKERLLGDYIRTCATATPDGTWRKGFDSIFADIRNFGRWFEDIFLRSTVGYGYRPWRVLVCFALFAAVGSILFSMKWRAGDITPSSTIVLTSAEWRHLGEDRALRNPAEVWSAADGPGRDYESFNAIGYTVDLFIPLVDFGQVSAWSPTTTRSAWGRVAFFSRWVIEGAGWILTAVGAAAITGLIRRE